MIPGLIDCHTHPVFAEPRLVDFEKRIGGAGYEEIAAAAGGIRSSVAAVRKSSGGELSKKVLIALNAMLQQGTTVVEAKSGYGLTLADEIKSLEAIRDAARQWPGEVIPTLLAAHVVPQEYAGKADDYVKLVCDQMIPLVTKKKLAKYVDVFCDCGAFTQEQSQKFWPLRENRPWNACACLPVHGGEAQAAAGVSACVFRSHGLRAAGRCFTAGTKRDCGSPAAGRKLFSGPQGVS